MLFVSFFVPFFSNKAFKPFVLNTQCRDKLVSVLYSVHFLILMISLRILIAQKKFIGILKFNSIQYRLLIDSVS